MKWWIKKELAFFASAIVVLFAFGGCDQPGGIDVRTVEVPTAVPCLPLAKIPAEPPLVDDQLTGNADADVNIVGASALLLRAWGQQMQAALVECAVR